MPREPAPAQQGTPLPLHGLDQVEIVASWGLPFPGYKRVDDRPGQVEYLESPFGFYVFGIEDF